MQIKNCDPESVRLVALNMRAQDYEEFSALLPVAARAELAEMLTCTFGRSREAYVVWCKGQPVAVGGFIETRPNVRTVLFFATEGFADVAVPLTKWIRRELMPSVITAGAHRIECVVKQDYWAARRWIGFFGLRHEASLAKYGKNGEPFELFAWVARDTC